MKYISIDEAKIENVDRALKSIMGILTPDNSGNFVTTQGYKLNIYIRVIMNYLMLSDFTYHNWDIIYYSIYSSVFEMKKYQVQDTKKLVELLDYEIDQYFSRPINQYLVVFPFHLMAQQKDKISDFEILGTKFVLKSWDNLKDEVDLLSFDKESKYLLANKVCGRHLDIHEKFIPYVCTAEGHSEEEAFIIAEKKYDLFRIIVNLIFNQYRFKQQWGGFPRPLANFLPPPIYGLFNKNGEWISYFYNLADYCDYGRNQITREDFQNAQNYTSSIQISEDPEDSLNLLIKALELYGAALDSSEMKLAFLYFWQILELLTLKSKKVTERQVIDRASKILQLTDSNKDLLEAMYNSRNFLIHEGHFPIHVHFAKDEVGLIKSVIDSLIDRFDTMRFNYPTITKLGTYYKSLDNNNK